MAELNTIIGKLKGLSALNALSLADIDDSIEEIKRAMEMLDEELSTLQVLRNVKVVMGKRGGLYDEVVQPVSNPLELNPAPMERGHKPTFRQILDIWGDSESRTIDELFDLLPHIRRPTISQALIQRTDLFYRIGRSQYVLKSRHTEQELEYMRNNSLSQGENEPLRDH